jgi:NAD(P)-dependent dehydrogenase (short-subunit alcohol dehydrogenase family)
MSMVAKSFSAVLIALPFSLSAFSDPLPPDLTYRPHPTLPFSRVKAADEAQKAAVTHRLAQLLAAKGIRANAVAPGPVWTPLIPSTLPEDAVANFGKQVLMKRPAQPAEFATAPLSSHVSGATIALTGGKPIL